MGYREIIKFWLPLLATWLLMATEVPFLNSFLARNPEVKINLAGFGVAFAVAILVEAPIINMLAASLRIVRDRESFRRLRNFNLAMCLAISLVMVIILLPGIFGFWAIGLIGLPERVAAASNQALLWLLPWPAAIGVRRFYQGLLIRGGMPRKVTMGTLIRLVTVFGGVALLGVWEWPFAAAGAAGLCLSLAVTAEAFCAWWFARPIVAKLQLTEVADEPWSLAAIWRFYYPLALTTLISLAVPPMTTMAAARAADPLESLAVLPVITAVVFVFRAIALSFQEVVIHFSEASEIAASSKLRNMVVALMAGNGTVFALLLVTPLGPWVFEVVLGLPHELVGFSTLPMWCIALVPILTVLTSFQRGFLIYHKHTRSISVSSLIELVTVMIVLLLGLGMGSFSGAVMVTVALSSGRLLANIYLWFVMRTSVAGVVNIRQLAP